MEKRFITIVTVTYNDCENLIRTIESVRSQKNNNFEYIIIDGGSNDDTLNVIEENNDIINYYVSEKDNGTYDAMNKGIEKCSGKYIMFLNSGDLLHSNNTIDNITKWLEKYKEVDIAYGDVVLRYNDKDRLKIHPSKITRRYLNINNICHQAMIFNKNLLDESRGFNLKEKIFADYELLIKSFNRNKKIYKINEIIAVYDMNGFSSRNNKLDTLKSRYRIVARHGNIKKKAIFIVDNILFKTFNYIKNNI